MVKHIILWQLKDELSAAEKAEIKANIKTGLEGLAGQIPGLARLHIQIQPVRMLLAKPDPDRKSACRERV